MPELIANSIHALHVKAFSIVQSDTALIPGKYSSRGRFSARLFRLASCSNGERVRRQRMRPAAATAVAAAVRPVVSFSISGSREATSLSKWLFS